MLGAVDDRVAGPADVGPVTAVVPALAGHPPDEHFVRPPRVPVRAPLGSLLNHWTEHAFEDRTDRRGQTPWRKLLRYLLHSRPPAQGRHRTAPDLGASHHLIGRYRRHMNIDFVHLRELTQTLSANDRPYLPSVVGVGLTALGAPTQFDALLIETCERGNESDHRVLMLAAKQLIFLDAPSVSTDSTTEFGAGHGQTGWSRSVSEVVCVELSSIQTPEANNLDQNVMLPTRILRFRDGTDINIPLFGPTKNAYGWSGREEFVSALLAALRSL